MKFKNEVIDDEILVYANDKLYSKEAIFKCLYWYGNKYRTNISFADENTYLISLKPLESLLSDTNSLHNTLQKLEKDLVDYNLRDIVSKETKNIRELLIAKAFSNGEFDEMPPGDVSDPVGFNPIEIG